MICLLLFIVVAAAVGPECRYQCSDPICHAVCAPKCDPPLCAAVCQEGSTCQSGYAPNCRTVCVTVDVSPSDSCPVCEIVCDPLSASACTGNCTALCQEPNCGWDCRKPQINCAYPTCTLMCEQPACAYSWASNLVPNLAFILVSILGAILTR
jgi:hypothetical protein